MKPLIYLTMSLILLLLSSCQEQASPTVSVSSASAHELTIWESYNIAEHELFLQQIANFQKFYQNQHGLRVEIKAYRVPFDDLETNVRLAALGKKTPDIARLDVLKVLELAYHQVLQPLDTLKNFDAPSIAAKREKYIPGAFDTNVIDIHGQTHLYGLPEQTTCLALFWNRKMFQRVADDLLQKGLDPKRAPKTWDELVQYGQVLTKINPQAPSENQYGFAMNNTLWWSLPFFGCYGVSYIQTDAQGNKTCLLGDDRSTAAFELKVALTREHGIEAGAWQSGALAHDNGFQNEKYAMILMGPWNIQNFRNAKLDFGVSLIPRIGKKEAIRCGLIPADASDALYLQKVLPATNIGGNNTVIFKTCRHPEIAYDFINYLASAEAQLFWCRQLNQIPVNVEAAKSLSQDPATDPDIAMFMQQALYATAPPLLPRYGFVENDIVNLEMELALKGQKKVRQALLDAGKRIDREILSLLRTEKK